VTDAIQPHPTRIEIVEPAPEEIEIGSAVTSRVTVSCAAGCDLEGMQAKLIASDSSEVVYQLASGEGGAEAIFEFDAPQTVGEHIWRIIFPAQTADGIVHEESTLRVAIKTTPHRSSLAVWSIPSPIVAGSRFTIKIGAKSSADCELRDQNVQVCDQNGQVIGSGTLNLGPWPGTTALYWTDIELTAPAQEGFCSLSARFEPSRLDTAHEGTSSQFQVAVVRPSEHSIKIRVFDKDTGGAIEDAQIRIGPYRAISNSAGLAEVDVAKGQYPLNVWKAGHEAPVETIDVNGDLEIEIAVVTLPEEDPDAAWMM
jgi:hypothetical protein